MTGLQVLLDPALAGIVRPGVLALEGLSVREGDLPTGAALREAEGRLRAGAASGEPATRTSAAVRGMYWRVGLDPTRRRPSSEALLRRVLKGEALPRVNTLVDVCNWCSAEVQLPYGAYDLGRVEGEVVLRLGREGEQYPGIRKDVVHVAGRLVVADRGGAFGNPTSDSARTMVTAATTAALVVIYAPADLGPSILDAAVSLTAVRILAHAGGRLVPCLVV